MDIQTLTQKVSDNTQIGKHDIQMIMERAFSILTNNSTGTTLSITPELSLFIQKI